MKFLLLGYSSIAQRRVVPALAAISRVEQIDIASMSKKPDASWAKAGRHFRDYEQAIAESEADTLYISLPNSMHDTWIHKGLAANKHVIVDKPATLTLESAKTLMAEAESRSLLLAEATVFDCHPQFDAMHDFINDYGPLTHIDSQFVIPPLPLENFRTQRKLGGGCLLDMGPYAAGLARQFGGVLTKMFVLTAPPSDTLDADVGFTVAAQFQNGVRYTGHFSFESEYQNRLLLVTQNGSLTVERLFSPPPNLPLAWQVRQKNEAREIVQSAADVFLCFLEAAIEAIYNGDKVALHARLIADATFRDAIQKKSFEHIH